MIYTYLNNTLVIEGSEGLLYDNNKLMFKGNSYIAIKLYIANSNNNPEVKDKFKQQLTMREQCRFKLKERMNPGVDHEQKIYTDPGGTKTKTQKRKRKSYT
tara:strand:+ start:1232 stop:1534 length:303 start_codon:yes stop_codon:yes gene_type:complete